jgi:predicted RNA-binding protein
MCESTVFIEKGGERELLMDDVVQVAVDGETIKVTGILGETKDVKGRIAEINLMKNTIVILQ